MLGANGNRASENAQMSLEESFSKMRSRTTARSLGVHVFRQSYQSKDGMGVANA
jgi:hypothetical protein